MLKLDTKAPNFSLLNSENKFYQLSDALGDWVIVYFYPKDDTPGCTKEACDFRDNMGTLTNKDCIVYGISRDNIESHAKFENKYDLNFTLLSDPDLTVHSAYQVLEGAKTVRTTFLIDKSGNIVKIWPNVKVDTHVQEIINYLKTLK